MIHKTVLLHEAIDGLEIKNGDIFFDGTLGGGGHSEEIAKRFAAANSNKKGWSVVMIALDLDPSAIKRASARIAPYKVPIHYIEDNFKNIETVLDSLKIPFVDKILLDIGLSSNQFEDSKRGFSFQKDEPLLMTFKEKINIGDLTAKEIVNTWDQDNIATILKSYGEEQFAWKIAKAIVAKREQKEIQTTKDLVEVILIATPKWYHHKKIHPATKTFQALRITVNDEIENLKKGLIGGWSRLNKGGRLAVISFHSIEDRAVKQFFKQKEKEGLGKLVNKKIITPSKEELLDNPRGRSAKLRIIEKL